MLDVEIKPIETKFNINSIKCNIAKCKFGFVLIAFSNHELHALFFGDHELQLEKEINILFPNILLKKNLTHNENNFIQDILNFIANPTNEFKITLNIKATSFQKEVWKALCHIPLGKTVSYSEVAIILGKPKSVRAVANACAQNTIAYIIPCHRVIKRNGELSGYRWGAERKLKMIESENFIANSNIL